MGNTTTFDELIASPISDKVFLCEAQPAEHLQGWDPTPAIISSALTCDLSLAAGTASIMNPSVDLTPYIGLKIKLTDPDEKALTGWIKAAGYGLSEDEDGNMDMGTNNFSWAGKVYVPSVAPASAITIAEQHDGTHGWRLQVLPTGYLRLTINATDYDSTATLAGVGVSAGLLTLGFSVARSSVSVAGSVLLAVEGVQLGASVAISAGAPTSVNNTAVYYVLGTSSTRPSALIKHHAFWNRALTVADHLAYKTDEMIAFADKWGSQTAKYSDTAWTGASGATPPTAWTAGAGGAVHTIFDSGDGFPFDTSWKIEINATPDANPWFYRTYSTVIGKSYRLEVWFKHVSGTSGEISLGTEFGSGNIKQWLGITDAAWTKYSHDFVATVATTYLYLRTHSSTTGQYELFDQVYLYEIGATIALFSSGVAIVSEKAGAVYNWSSDDGIDPMAVSFAASLDPAPDTYQKSFLNETITLADGATETLTKIAAAMKENGVAYTAKTSIADVDAAASSFYHDTTNGVLYVHASDSGTPDDFTIMVLFWVYFATRGIVLDGRYYEPYIAQNGIPAINQETQKVHWGACRISSGSVKLLNARGFFDQIARRWVWNNKDLQILFGGDALPYSEYTSIFKGKIKEARFTKTDYTLEIQSSAFDLLRSLPVNSYWTSDYPNLDPAAEGKPQPCFWGVYNASQAPLCTCIDTAYGVNEYQFNICDTTHHAIRAITQVYIDYGDGLGWRDISHSNENLADATFTLASASFVVGTTRVKASFEGYHESEILIEGAPEIARDILLNQCGYSVADLNEASFTASGAISECVLNVALINATSALTIIETICQSDLAFFDEDGSGALRYRTWEPSKIGDLPVLA